MNIGEIRTEWDTLAFSLSDGVNLFGGGGGCKALLSANEKVS
jgi:hypothetical protein